MPPRIFCLVALAATVQIFATPCLAAHLALRGAPQSHVRKVSLKAPPHYTFTDLGVSPDYSPAAATCINSHGVICGNIGLRSYKWVKGQKVSLGFLPQTPEERHPFMAHPTTANAINDRGVVVGADTYSMLDDNFPRAVMWRHGKTEDLGEGIAVAINNKNMVLIHDFYEGDFLWSHGKRTRIVGQGWLVETMNNHGNVMKEIRVRTLLWRRGKARRIDGKWLNTHTTAVALNDHQSILFVSEFAGRTMRSYLWRHGNLTNPGQIAGNSQSALPWGSGRIYDLAQLVHFPADYSQLEVYDINDAGAIVGSIIFGGKYHAFLLKPRK